MTNCNFLRLMLKLNPNILTYYCSIIPISTFLELYNFKKKE